MIGKMYLYGMDSKERCVGIEAIEGDVGAP